MKQKKYLVFTIGLGLVIGLSACNISLAQDITPPPGYQAPAAQKPVVLQEVFPLADPDPVVGAEIYQDKCQPCHGDTGLGDGPTSMSITFDVSPIGTAEYANQSSPIEWFTTISEGRLDKLMPFFSESLSQQDIWDVMAFVYSLTTTPEQLKDGETVYQNFCAECHGVEGLGDGPAVEGAANFRDAEKMVSLSGDDIIMKLLTGNGNESHVFADELDSDEQLAVAAYIRSFVFGKIGEEGIIAIGEPEDSEPSTDVRTQEPIEAEEEEGEIEEEVSPSGLVFGTVVNGSGGEVPEDLEVTLYGYDHFEVAVELTTVIDADGRFSFEGIDFVPEFVFFTAVDYMETTYGSDFHIAGEGDSHLDLSVTIYETTADPSALVIDRMHVFFEFITPEVVQVVHSLSVSNQGDKSVISPDITVPTLRYVLPDGAENLIFQEGSIGQPYVKTADGFGDPSSIPPGSGEYQILYAYELPYSGNLEWVQPLNFPVDVVVLLIPDSELELESEMVEASGTETLNETLYQVFVGGPEPAGGEFRAEISGRISSAASGLSLGTDNTTIILGGAGLALALIGVWWWFKPQPTGKFAYQDENTPERVMDEIIALDENFEEGAIGEAAYHRKRAGLKERLRVLMKN